VTNFTEAETRQRHIDSELAAAGCAGNNLPQVEEFALGTAEIVREATSRYGETRGIVDYVLVGTEGKPLAVVEARCTSRDPLVGKRQASDYADQILAKFGIAPFIFLTNGQEILFWNR